VKIAIIGATGAVGRQMLADLESLKIDNIEPILIASHRSVGCELYFKGKAYKTKAWDLNLVTDVKYCLLSAGADFSREYAEKIVENNCVVIDNSSAWRMYEHVPLIVPEVNIDLVKEYSCGIIANPNCSTIQMSLVLFPLLKKFGLEKVIVSTYQSVSGSGQKGINELIQQNIAKTKNLPLDTKYYGVPIAGNILPSIGSLDSSGYCEEEIKMIEETRKIFDYRDLDIMATTVRVPVVRCHCESLTVELSCETSSQQIKECLEAQEGVVIDCNKETEIFSQVTPLSVEGSSSVYVSRIRSLYGKKSSKWFNIWCVADNLRKGAATNAVQILKNLLKST
jgi:aspartate-semialdehyde dehydrogenase